MQGEVRNRLIPNLHDVVRHGFGLRLTEGPSPGINVGAGVRAGSSLVPVESEIAVRICAATHDVPPGAGPGSRLSPHAIVRMSPLVAVWIGDWQHVEFKLVQ